MGRITINLATFPPRKTGLAARLLELSPQCDLMRVYLNGYKHWPKDIFRPNNVEYICGDGRQAPDLGSQGKLFWIDPAVDEHYLTCDDDIRYSTIYAAHMVTGCMRYDNQAVVSLHGGSFRMPKGNLPDDVDPRSIRKLLSYTAHIPRDTAVMLAGNGIMCCHPMTLGLHKDDLIRGPLHSGDDEDMAIWCQRRKKSVIVLAHNGGLACADFENCNVQAQFANPECVAKQNTKLRSWRRWQVTPRPTQKGRV